MDYLHTIGIMTGNSLDGADVVLSRIHRNGLIEDMCAYGTPMPQVLSDRLRELRAFVQDSRGVMPDALEKFDSTNGPEAFRGVIRNYTKYVAENVQGLLEKAARKAVIRDRSEVDLIGFHGQTCAHFPPSLARATNQTANYTVQVGNGQLLADLCGITVVCDFRSDDLFNGGEGAPLAPLHHAHLAESVRHKGCFPFAFCNAGNTGNISVISFDHEQHCDTVLGWDTGPFNHYPDSLMRREKGENCDRDCRYGEQGNVNIELLRILFNTAAVTGSGDNFLEQYPPKSSDPQWYRDVSVFPELAGMTPCGGIMVRFEDRLRTAEYFSAYAFAYSLCLLPPKIEMPTHFALCGGGWKNRLCFSHFQGILTNIAEGKHSEDHPILPEHDAAFGVLTRRFDKRKVHVEPSEMFGFDGTVMEARIMADAAVCRIRGIPFTTPQTTGTAKPSVCGIIRFPYKSRKNATPKLQQWLTLDQGEHLTPDSPQIAVDPDWSRAAGIR